MNHISHLGFGKLEEESSIEMEPIDAKTQEVAKPRWKSRLLQGTRVLDRITSPQTLLFCAGLYVAYEALMAYGKLLEAQSQASSDLEILDGLINQGIKILNQAQENGPRWLEEALTQFHEKVFENWSSFLNEQNDSAFEGVNAHFRTLRFLYQELIYVFRAYPTSFFIPNLSVLLFNPLIELNQNFTMGALPSFSACQPIQNQTLFTLLDPTVQRVLEVQKTSVIVLGGVSISLSIFSILACALKSKCVVENPRWNSFQQHHSFSKKPEVYGFFLGGIAVIAGGLLYYIHQNTLSEADNTFGDFDSNLTQLSDVVQGSVDACLFSAKEHTKEALGLIDNQFFSSFFSFLDTLQALTEISYKEAIEAVNSQWIAPTNAFLQYHDSQPPLLPFLPQNSSSLIAFNPNQTLLEGAFQFSSSGFDLEELTFKEVLHSALEWTLAPLYTAAGVLGFAGISSFGVSLVRGIKKFYDRSKEEQQ